MKKQILIFILALAVATDASAERRKFRLFGSGRRAAERTEQAPVTPAVVPAETLAAPPATALTATATPPAVETEAEAEAEAAGWTLAPAALDSLVWFAREADGTAMFESYFAELMAVDTTVIATSDTPDSVYERRLRSILSPIPMSWNETVKPFVVMFTSTRRQTMGNILANSQYYFPIIEQELSNAGLPIELRMLAVVESALVPTARSRAGAVGLWQFMHVTGRENGLSITTFVDERRDPVASTRAACKYLSTLYRIYGDWTLALAAYNCGPGNVNKARSRAGGDAKTFWDIYPYLPAETRTYVPLFIAATYAYTFHKQHGIDITPRSTPLVVDTVAVRRLVHLEQVAKTLDIPIETVRDLNPQYIKDIVPAIDKPYPIVLPFSHLASYIERDSLIHKSDSVYLAEYLNPSNAATTKKLMTAAASLGTTHRVRKGETLGGIARRYGVSTSQLVRWNNLRSAHKLQIGQRIEIRK